MADVKEVVLKRHCGALLRHVGFWVFGMSLLAFLGLTRGFSPGGMGLPTVALGTAAGLFTLVRFFTTGRHLRAVARGTAS